MFIPQVIRQTLLDTPAHTAWGDAVSFVVVDLFLPSVTGNRQKLLDAVGHHIGIKIDFSV